MRVHSRLRQFAVVVGLLGLTASAACTNSSTSGNPLPPTTVPATTEVFSGTVAPQGRSSNDFVVRRSNGQLTVTLTAAAPPAGVTLGLGVGNPSSTGCVLIPQATIAVAAGAGPHIESLAAPAATYCVAVFDPTNVLTSAVDYSVRVTHY